jgi:hypothetical protein
MALTIPHIATSSRGKAIDGKLAAIEPLIWIKFHTRNKCHA